MVACPPRGDLSEGAGWGLVPRLEDTVWSGGPLYCPGGAVLGVGMVSVSLNTHGPGTLRPTLRSSARALALYTRPTAGAGACL